MVDYHSIRSVHLEISTRCNAACPMCPRNISGYDMDLGYPVHDMRLDEAQKIFTPKFLKQIDNILINGNFGDFVTARDNLKIIKYFVEQNSNIRIEISTNASARPNIWSELGCIPNVIVGFALDGLKDTHSLYRRNTDWDLVISNAKNFIAAGGKAVWRMIQFEHNRHQRADCEQMAKDLGFYKFDPVYDGRDRSPVYDNRGNFKYKIGNDPNVHTYPESALIWKSWSDQGGKPEVRKKQYPTFKIKDRIECHSNKQKEIYINAIGEIYPCCWLGFYPKLQYQHAWQTDNFQVAELIQSNNNALEVGIESAINWFNNIEQSWQKQSYQEGRLVQCDSVCGRFN